MLAIYNALLAICLLACLVSLFMTVLFVFSGIVNHDKDIVKGVIFGIITIVMIVGIIHTSHYGALATMNKLTEKINDGYRVYVNGQETELENVDLDACFIKINNNNKKILLTIRY